jgi:flavin reductase (DIM6/NTAB) family NADH-FMN oxidoreductase RutF
MRESSFSRVMGALDGAMAVVTASDGVRIAGCLVGFGGQSSIDPPRYVVYLSKINYTHRVARRSTHLMVHFLSSDQIDLARHFGELTGDESAKFDDVRWAAGPDGVTPRLTDCRTHMWGLIVRRHHRDGDHTAFVLEPLSTRADRGFEPLRLRDAIQIDAGHPLHEK